MMKKSILLVSLVLLFSLHLVYAGSKGDIDSVFSTGGMYCYRTARTAEWVAHNNSANRINATNNCSLYTNETLGIGPCCPTDTSLSFCNSTGMCSDGRLINLCENYKNQDACEKDFNRVGLNSVRNSSLCGISSIFIDASGNTCVNITKCGCFWNTTHSLCEARTKFELNCYTKGISDYGQCIWSSSIVEDNCNNSRNNRVITSIARWVSGNPPTQNDPIGYTDCVNITRVYPCIATTKLPFFTLTNLVVAISLLAMIYVVYSLKKEILNKRKDL